ncbi:MAG TPA: hypothetical protein PL151_17985 [Phycisphaerae bacterium]|nr:hypothetical protein [Phycisphaerae bacterium]HOJ74719.1 hypothetical protein [Phycisphaerae bacterium]HOM52088.1 hypothetical protein [Phycisphaerae bacterium]HOQ86131.1 hypothetical protein [Phycisphaerae bacterium]HPP27615.1 hypothetical protein [Phycisphaerae bacterium]
MASLVTLLSMSATVGLQPPVRFTSARPIWPEGREKEINVFVGFRAVIDAPQEARTILRLTGSSIYRVTVNGEFLGHGPARGPHGFFRIDELDLTPALRAGRNVVAIEVAGYNTNSFYLLDQPSFLQAEIIADEKVLAATGAGDPSDGIADFEAFILPERVQKVARYSFQRPASEVYRLQPGYTRWKTDPAARIDAVACAILPTGQYLPRRVPYSTFNCRPVVWDVGCGTIKTGVEPANLYRDRSLVNIGPQLKGYPESELDTVPSVELQKTVSEPGPVIDQPFDGTQPVRLNANTYRLLDFGTNLTGFIGMSIACQEKTRLFLAFDEILSNGDVNFTRLQCVNVILLELEPGEYAFESFEPYTLRYLKPIVLEGACTLSNIYLREFVNPDVHRAHFAASDVRLNKLFEAGRETFRQNATDIFMDCPSRERAGWLCDSYFTSRVALDFMGNTVIEKNFLENFLLPPGFAKLPEGMLPMCYPADHYDGVFIPNWSMWFVVELEEYLARSGDRTMVDALRPRVLRLLEFFKQFENTDGLLVNLPSWVFVEWSAANNFVRPLNYPSNMLYSGMLAAAGRIYGIPELIRKAEAVRDTIRQQSFDGEFFVDNAEIKDGKVVPTRNRTETCQYYAFFFDVATPEMHGELFRRLIEDFGPDRKETKKFPEIHPANSFIGNVLRMEILSRHGRGQQILNESIDYLLYMADRTGTLWENVDPGASCNHGFASHIVHTLYRDIAGLYRVDAIGRRIELRFCDVTGLNWCEGSVPVRDGMVSLRWWKEGDRTLYRLDAPAGYTVTVQNLTGRELVRKP